MSRVKMTVLSDADAPSLVLAVLPAFAESAGIAAEDEQRLRDVVDRLVAFTLENAYPDDDLGEIEVTVEVGDGSIHVAVHDWGLPLTSAGAEFGPLPETLAVLARDAANLELLNLGAAGKRLTADVPVRVNEDRASARHYADALSPRASAGGAQDVIAVRRARPDDAEAIAQLLYENYHLSYVHADYYRPRYLAAALASGELLSTLAVHEERIVGHHALMPSARSRSAETGAAVVHSAYRGLGIFGRLFEQTLETARELGLASVFGDAVTIHPFSQRAEHAHGYRETALQLAMVPAKTTMRGFDADAPRLRTATLRSYLRFDEKPRRVTLPDPYRELLESIYSNVGLTLQPPRRRPRADGETVVTVTDEPRALGFLRLRRWDDGARQALKRSVRHLLSLHVDVVYADVDLEAVDEIDEAVAALNELAFFVAGGVLHGMEGHDHLRLQRLDSEKVELENIVCDSSFAAELRRQVLDDMARVVG